MAGTKDDARWDKNFKVLKEFKEEYGRLPKMKEEYKGVKIGRWVANIRYYYNLKHEVDRRIVLDEKRMEDLESIGFIFGDWTIHFDILVRFKEEYGRFPETYETYEGFEIGMYCNNIRARYNHSYGHIKDNLLKALEKIDFPLTDWKDYKWNMRFGFLKEFKEKHGRLPKCNEKYNGFCLGAWMYRERRKTDNPERIERLKSIGVEIKGDK